MHRIYPTLLDAAPIPRPFPSEQGLLARQLAEPAYLLQTHEMLFDAHYQAFRVFGGVPRRGIYDNMRTAVDRVHVGKKRQVNARFAAMASHYLFDADFCIPHRAGRRGKSRKTCRTHVTGCGSQCRGLRRLMT